MAQYFAQAYFPLVSQKHLPCGDCVCWKMLTRHVDRSNEKIRIFGVNNDWFQSLKCCQLDRFMGLIAQFHEHRPRGFTHYMRTEYTGTKGGHMQAQGVFVVILVLYQ